MRIYIPTIQRLDRQLSWELLPEYQRRNTVLVCPSNEVDEHRRRGRNAIACDLKGIAKVREWIIHRGVQTRQTKIGVLDDDLTEIVYTPRPSDAIPGRSWNTPINAQDWTDIFDWIDSWLDITPTCGLADGLQHPSEQDTVMPGRLMRNHFYNLATLPVDDIDWSSVRYAEDFHVTLQLIGLGYPNIINNRYRVLSIATQQPGGCSAEGRERDNHNAAMRRLIELHHPWIRQSNKQRVGADDWIKVTIRWQAYWKHVRQEVQLR